MFRTGLKYTFTLVILVVMLVMQSSQVTRVAGQKIVMTTNSSANSGMFTQRTNQIMIKYKDSAAGTMGAPASSSQAQRLSTAAGESLAYIRAMSGGAHVLRLSAKKSVADVQAVARRLAQLPEVEYAEPDRILYHTMIPNDPQYPSQWHYSAPSASSYGINLPAAWDITKGSDSVVVAVIDTGITNHPEFTGRTVPGYDFIADTFVANDGNGRDADPSDPGDWITTNQCYAGSPADDSSWHGTHTAGTIGAASNNNDGVAGVNWNSKILPVRVLGRCGGYESDIVDGMRWAAGLPVTGVPDNPNPAEVLSISLGGGGACSTAEQNAINEITAAGTTVVVAAGNSASDASGFQPASCDGVITVAATDRYGDMAYYSNYGSTVEIAAPGGDTYYNATDGVYSTLNTGTQGPLLPTYAYYQGTSMATPHVAGVVSLLYSLNPAITPAQALSILQSTATGFPVNSYCKIYGCGSGIVNAGAAAAEIAGKINTTTTITTDLSAPSDVGQAVTVLYTVTPASGSGIPTGTVTVSGGGSSCTGSVAAGQCTIIFNIAGSKMLVATYSGDANYNGGASTRVSHQVNGTNSYLYMPILRIDPSPTPVPMAHLTVYNQTNGTLCFELLGTGIGKKCFSSSSWDYGYFITGYYTYNASARCGSLSRQYYYGIGENSLTFSCTTSAAQNKDLLSGSMQSH